MVDKMTRHSKLTELHVYLKHFDTEVTMMLQSLQWDRKHLVEKQTLVGCRYDSNHRVPPDKIVEHERKCLLKSQGYSDKDCLLPSPLDPDASTLVKLSSENIAEIIKNASTNQASFRTVIIGPIGCAKFYILCIFIGAGCSGDPPLTLDRLQVTYTSDERRAIHDAVVNQVSSSHDLSDLAHLSASDEVGGTNTNKAKSKIEFLAELRDMKRRRAKYRVPAKTRNYSDVLRDVISTQMECFTQAQDNIESKDQSSHAETKDDHRKSKDRNESSYGDYSPKRKHHNNESGLSQDEYKTSSHSRYSEEYESRKRKREDSYNHYRHTQYSKREERPEPHSRKSQCKEDSYRYSKSKRRDDRNIDSTKSDREVYTHYDDHEKHKRQREKYSDYRRKAETTIENRGLAVRIKKERFDSYNDDNDDCNSRYSNKIIKKERRSTSGSGDEARSVDTYSENKSRNTHPRTSQKFTNEDKIHKKKHGSNHKSRHHHKNLYKDNVTHENKFDGDPSEFRGSRDEDPSSLIYSKDNYDRHQGSVKIKKRHTKYNEDDNSKKHRREDREKVKEKH